MTDHDLMPFGKHKGLPMSQVPKTYGAWLCQQDGFKEKNPGLYEYFTKGPSKPEAGDMEFIIAEAELMGQASDEFKSWWDAAYGKRLKLDKSPLFIPHLRIALAAFQAGHSVAKHKYNVEPPPVKIDESKIHRPKNPDVKDPNLFLDDGTPAF